jgi:DNA-binding transcriptional LysR family regulator
VLTAADELTMADLAGETLLCPLDDVLGLSQASAANGADRPQTTAEAVAWAAANAGILVVPQSLARANHRRDLTYRVVSDAPQSSVALVWPKDDPSEHVETMIGIVRGRTANSTRGGVPAPPVAAPARKPRRPGPDRQAPPGRRRKR